MKKVYLDNNATSCLDPHVYAIYSKELQESYGNPSSVHSYGQEAKAKLICAREEIASHLKVRSQEVFFTSTATEALNLLIRGIIGTNYKGHIVTSNVEHPAVFRTIKELELRGVRVTFLPVGPKGAIDPLELQASLATDTRLIVLMAANNETGVLSDLPAIAAIAARSGIPLLVDGVAIFGKAHFTLHPGISSICFSGHKFHAPKGVGFTIIRKGLKVEPQITGGAQERGFRAGTENVPAICALAAAVKITELSLEGSLLHMQSLRDFFEEELLSRLSFARVNGTGLRVVNVSNICFEGIDGEALLMYLDLHGVAASLGSACSSGSLEPSRILLEMGLTRDQALSSLRFSLSRFTTKEEIDYALEVIYSGVQMQRR